MCYKQNYYSSYKYCYNLFSFKKCFMRKAILYISNVLFNVRKNVNYSSTLK